jgi:hypothetical protein
MGLATSTGLGVGQTLREVMPCPGRGGSLARQVQIVNGSKSLRVGHPVASVNPHRQSTLTSAPNHRQRVWAGLRARRVKFTNAGSGLCLIAPQRLASRVVVAPPGSEPSDDLPFSG